MIPDYDYVTERAQRRLGSYGSFKGKPDVVISGMRGEQPFFVAYAQRWRKVQTEAALRLQIATDSLISLTRMQDRELVERRHADEKTVLVAITALGKERLDDARPIHAASVRRNLLSRLTQEQIDTIVRVSNLLGEGDYRPSRERSEGSDQASQAGPS